MTTGVWSKRIAEANERRGGQPQGLGLAYASIVLCAVVGLGLRVKLRTIRMLSSQFYEEVYVERVRKAQRAQSAGRRFDPRRGFGHDSSSQQKSGSGGRAERHEQQQQQWNQWQRHKSTPLEKASTMESYRALLGVRRGATKRELKNAYYLAAKRLHPDTADSGGKQDDAESTHGERFKAVKIAYDALLQNAQSP